MVYSPLFVSSCPSLHLPFFLSPLRSTPSLSMQEVVALAILSSNRRLPNRFWVRQSIQISNPPLRRVHKSSTTLLIQACGYFLHRSSHRRWQAQSNYDDVRVATNAVKGCTIVLSSMGGDRPRLTSPPNRPKTHILCKLTVRTHNSFFIRSGTSDRYGYHG
jgi:hypothetical protein